MTANVRRPLPQLSALVMLLLACSPRGADAAPADGGSAPQQSVGGEVYRGEAGGFTVVLSWSKADRLELHLSNPHPKLKTARMMCAEKVGAELPPSVQCEHGRGLQLERTKAGLQVTLNDVLAKEVFYFTADGDKGKPGPTTYSLRRVDPIATAYDAALFGADAKYSPNSSPETRHLPGEVKIAPASPDRIRRAVQRAGVDPATLWLDLVDTLRRRVESLQDYSDWQFKSKEERETFIDENVAEILEKELRRARSALDAPVPR